MYTVAPGWLVAPDASVTEIDAAPTGLLPGTSSRSPLRQPDCPRRPPAKVGSRRRRASDAVRVVTSKPGRKSRRTLASGNRVAHLPDPCPVNLDVGPPRCGIRRGIQRTGIDEIESDYRFPIQSEKVRLDRQHRHCHCGARAAQITDHHLSRCLTCHLKRHLHVELISPGEKHRRRHSIERHAHAGENSRQIAIGVIRAVLDVTRRAQIRRIRNIVDRVNAAWRYAALNPGIRRRTGSPPAGTKVGVGGTMTQSPRVGTAVFAPLVITRLARLSAYVASRLHLECHAEKRKPVQTRRFVDLG